MYFYAKFLYMQLIDNFRAEFLSYLEQKNTTRQPENLYNPINYILGLGGKRLRPVLTLLTCDMLGGNSKEALDAALAIEIFHNFSLVHDDIMDDASLRRGMETVHEKWDLNTGILSGDAMMIIAYQCFENYEAPTFKKLAQLFSKTALEVCEGQQYDIDFETRTDVTIEEYLEMIKLKTSVLVAAAMNMGAIVANACDKDMQKIYDFGLHLGLAFQLQDDYLDTFGDVATFGKQIGGDILENKKTYLYLKAFENASEVEKKRLEELFKIEDRSDAAKVAEVTQLFLKTSADKETLTAIKKYTIMAFEDLNELSVSEENKNVLREFGKDLMQRKS